jgi:hypothetical protein
MKKGNEGKGTNILLYSIISMFYLFCFCFVKTWRWDNKAWGETFVLGFFLASNEWNDKYYDNAMWTV